MYSDNLVSEYKNFIESLNIDSLKKLKHRPINDKFNLIGSIVISKSNENKELVIYNLLKQSKELNGLYIHLNVQDYPNKEKDLELSFQSLLLYFSDIIIVKWHLYDSDLNNLIVYPFHSVDHVFIFDQYTEYDKDTVNYIFNNRTDRVIQNLSTDDYHKRRIYKDSIFLYSLKDDSYEYKTLESFDKPCIENMVKKDIFIPAYTIDEEFDIFQLQKEFSNNLEVFNIYNCFKNEYQVEICKINETSYKNEGIDLLLYKIIHSSDIRERWGQVFPGYDFSIYGDICIKNILSSTFEVASIGYNFPEFLVENLNKIRHNIIGHLEKITVLENTHHYQLSMSSNVRDVLALRMKNINYLNNMSNEYLEFTKPDRMEKPYYGYKMYEESVKYLYDNCEQDYLVVFNTKIILKSELLFDDNDLYCKYGDYIKVFNIKKLKAMGIKFETFAQFEKDVGPIKELDLDAKTIKIPYDFDKFNGVMFLFARLRYKIIQKYIQDNYGVNLVYDKFWNNR